MVIHTERLFLLPFTRALCEAFMQQDFTDLGNLGLKPGQSWPDQDVIETLPKIIQNLADLESPTGFESWMVIKTDTMEIIGDAGFKGLVKENKSIDLGYGIIAEERRKGYAEEAAIGLIKWAFNSNKVNFISAHCLADNHASMHLLQKLGFTKQGEKDSMITWKLTNYNLN